MQANGYVNLINTNEVPRGRARVVEYGKYRLAVCHTADGKFYVIEDRCTHDWAPFDGYELIGCEIECVRHGARFDVRSGAALSYPGYFPTKSFPCVVGDGYVAARIG